MAFGSIKSRNVEYKLASLENGGSREMNVDGSSVIKNFDHAIAGGEVWFLEQITFFLLDSGTMSNNVFGALSGALTNGLGFGVKKSGTNFIVKEIFDNVDVYMSFPFNINIGSVSTGFLNEEDYFCGSFDFKNDLRLIGDDGDLVRFSIKDNCSSIQRMRASALMWRPI